MLQDSVSSNVATELTEKTFHYEDAKGEQRKPRNRAIFLCPLHSFSGVRHRSEPTYPIGGGSP